MKKFGFTLAEVLISLGIVGVVAALTVPALLNDTQGAQVGPKLGKAAAMFEQANQAMLNDNQVDSLTDGNLTNNYLNNLSNYLKITPYRGNSYNVPEDEFAGFEVNNNSYISKDGVVYRWLPLNAINANRPPHITRIGNIFIDINGSATPNLPGTDVFVFTLMNDGSLIACGAWGWDGGNQGNNLWRASCGNNQTPVAGSYYRCTASIFENNMRVMYRMR